MFKKTVEFVNAYGNGIKLTIKFYQLIKTKGGQRLFEQC